MGVETDAATGARMEAIGPESNEQEGERILVVEDHPQFRNVIGRILSMGGYAFDSAGGGSVALAMLEQRTYALLLTDVLLPDISGIALVAQMRERLDSPPAVLLMSGGGPRALSDRARAGEGDPILAKPFEAEQLLQQVRRLLA